MPRTTTCDRGAIILAKFVFADERWEAAQWLWRAEERARLTDPLFEPKLRVALALKWLVEF